ncbi:hypothetical protein LXL04_021906 [Taraxacum kok-saghyz]
MAKGRLRCIENSISLKSRFGTGYIVHINLSPTYHEEVKLFFKYVNVSELGLVTPVGKVENMPTLKWRLQPVAPFSFIDGLIIVRLVFLRSLRRLPAPPPFLFAAAIEAATDALPFHRYRFEDKTAEFVPVVY